MTPQITTQYKFIESKNQLPLDTYFFIFIILIYLFFESKNLQCYHTTNTKKFK